MSGEKTIMLLRVGQDVRQPLAGMARGCDECGVGS